MMRMFSKIYFTQVETALLVLLGPGWIKLAMKLVAQWAFDLGCRNALGGAQRYLFPVSRRHV
ncbi:MAG: hypothetical protein ACI9PZ_002281 [Parvicella sp.]|jgi:hypothetical protein